MKKHFGLWLLAFSVLIAIIFGVTFLAQEFVFSDYIVYDDFKTENTYSCQTSSYSKECSNSKWQWSTGSSGSPSEAINFDGLYLSTNVDTISEITIKQPLSLGNDFRWLLTTQFYCGHSKVWAEGIGQLPELSGFGVKDWVVEYVADDLDSTKYAILVNGQLVGEVAKSSLQPTLRVQWHFSGETCRASGGDSLKIHKLEYRLPYNCPRGANDVFATETFRGGQTIDLYSTRYPVKSFCLDAPAIITAPEGIDSTASVYDKLKRGQKLDIPLSQTWTLFYYFDNTNKLIPNTCDYLKEWFDVDIGACTSQTGIVHLCSEGVWDSNLKACLVEAPPLVLPGTTFYDCGTGQLQTDPVCLGTPVIKYNCNGQLQDSPTCVLQPGYQCNGQLQDANTCVLNPVYKYECNGVLQDSNICPLQAKKLYFCNGIIQESPDCTTVLNETIIINKTVIEQAVKFYDCAGVISKESACTILLPVDQLCKEGTINAEAGTCIAPGKVVCPTDYEKREIAPDQFECVKQGKLITLSSDVVIDAPSSSLAPREQTTSKMPTYLITAFIIIIMVIAIMIYALSRKK